MRELKGSRRFAVADLVSHVRIEPGHIEIAVSAGQVFWGSARPQAQAPTITLTEHMYLTRTGRVVRLVDESGQA